MSAMHNPAHPGEFINEVYLKPLGITAKQLADAMEVTPSTVSRLIKGSLNVTPSMAMRLSKVLKGSPEFWLNMQCHYDIWKLRQLDPFSDLHPLKMTA